MLQFHSNRVSMDPTSQVQVVRVTFGQTEETLALVIDLLNISDKTITGIKFDVIFLNARGKYIFDKAIFSHSYQDLSIEPGSLFYLEPWQLDERHQTARSALVRISEVHFEDGTRKYFNIKKENTYTLPIIPKEKLQRLQSIFGQDLITYGSKIKNAWRCICGTTNPQLQDTCRLCERNKDFVLSTLTERQINQKLYSMIQKDQNEDLDPEILIHQSSHQVEDIKKLESTRRGTEEELQMAPTPLKRKIFLVLASILALVFLYQTGSFIYKKVDTQNTLKRAETYILAGRYEEALSLYKDLAPYTNNLDMTLKIEDTQNLIKSAENYNRGVELTIGNNSLGALYAFSRVLPDDAQNYAKSQAMISSLKQDIINNIRTDISNGKLNEALTKADDLLYLLPEDSEIADLREEILGYMGR